MVRNQPTVLCATHFHELTTFFDGSRQGQAAGAHDGEAQDNREHLGNIVVNMHAAAHVDDVHHTVTMLYQIRPGPALRSYGVNVAQAVRFPEAIVEEARRLEEYNSGGV